MKGSSTDQSIISNWRWREVAREEYGNGCFGYIFYLLQLMLQLMAALMLLLAIYSSQWHLYQAYQQEDLLSNEKLKQTVVNTIFAAMIFVTSIGIRTDLFRFMHSNFGRSLFYLLVTSCNFYEGQLVDLYKCEEIVVGEQFLTSSQKNLLQTETVQSASCQKQLIPFYLTSLTVFFFVSSLRGIICCRKSYLDAKQKKAELDTDRKFNEFLLHEDLSEEKVTLLKKSETDAIMKELLVQQQAENRKLRRKISRQLRQQAEQRDKKRHISTQFDWRDVPEEDFSSTYGSNLRPKRPIEELVQF